MEQWLWNTRLEKKQQAGGTKKKQKSQTPLTQTTQDRVEQKLWNTRLQTTQQAGEKKRRAKVKRQTPDTDNKRQSGTEAVEHTTWDSTPGWERKKQK